MIYSQYFTLRSTFLLPQKGAKSDIQHPVFLRIIHLWHCQKAGWVEGCFLLERVSNICQEKLVNEGLDGQRGLKSADEGSAHDHSKFIMRHYKPLRTLLVCISQSFFTKRRIAKNQSPCCGIVFFKGCLRVRTVAKMSSLLLLEKGKNPKPLIEENSFKVLLRETIEVCELIFSISHLY